jgi:hypothetical protein
MSAVDAAPTPLLTQPEFGEKYYDAGPLQNYPITTPPSLPIRPLKKT